MPIFSVATEAAKQLAYFAFWLITPFDNLLNKLADKIVSKL